MEKKLNFYFRPMKFELESNNLCLNKLRFKSVRFFWHRRHKRHNAIFLPSPSKGVNKLRGEKINFVELIKKKKNKPLSSRSYDLVFLERRAICSTRLLDRKKLFHKGKVTFNATLIKPIECLPYFVTDEKPERLFNNV